MALTTAEWDAQWRWNVGTRVTVNGLPGTVTKQNPTTVNVLLDDGRTIKRVPMLHPALQRTALVCADSPACRDRGCADCERSYGPRKAVR